MLSYSHIIKCYFYFENPPRLSSTVVTLGSLTAIVAAGGDVMPTRCAIVESQDGKSKQRKNEIHFHVKDPFSSKTKLKI